MLTSLYIVARFGGVHKRQFDAVFLELEESANVDRMRGKKCPCLDQCFSDLNRLGYLPRSLNVFQALVLETDVAYGRGPTSVQARRRIRRAENDICAKHGGTKTAVRGALSAEDASQPCTGFLKGYIIQNLLGVQFSQLLLSFFTHTRLSL